MESSLSGAAGITSALFTEKMNYFNKGTNMKM